MPGQLPYHRRITLDEFLAFTGFELTPGDSRAAMDVALAFYQDKIPRPRLIQKVANPSPWSLPRGNGIYLSELMQAINFSYPVQRLIAQANERFVSFRPRHEPRSKRPKGHWFTPLSGTQESLAIPGEQDSARVYVVKAPVECLKSRVSDAFTWIVKSQEQIQQESFSDKYFRGGGIQYFIWDAERSLELA